MLHVLYFKKELDNVVKNGIKIQFIGKINQLPSKLKKVLIETSEKTKNNKKIKVNLAINYGSKKELIDAFKKIKNNKDINEKKIKLNLYTKNEPDPDILIRTGGQKRLSNFLLWQLAYSEIYFLDKLWPDFSIKDLKKILRNFRGIQRNYGAI